MADTSDFTIAEHLKWRKPTRNQPLLTDPNPQMPSLIQSSGCKSTISSLIISSFSNHENSNNKSHPKKTFKNSALRGFGCTAQPDVTVPAVIRSSADWEERDKEKKGNCSKKKKKKKKNTKQLQGVLMAEDSIGIQDLWCADASAAAPVDCVRPRIDLVKLHHKQRASYNSRQRLHAESFTSMGLDSSFHSPQFGLDTFESRYYHHLHTSSPQLLMCQNGLMANRRSANPDRYQEWRLDVDNMTYEELLELGDRIGYVSTGLAEDHINRCVRRTKLPVLNEVPSQPHKSVTVEGKCSICQEEYKEGDEVGKLKCEHDYHLHCIKQWLARKNACPVCKAEVSSL